MEKFYEQNYCDACHTMFAVFFPLPSCCVSSLFLRDGKLLLSRHAGPGKQPIKGYGNEHLDRAQFLTPGLLSAKNRNNL